MFENEIIMQSNIPQSLAHSQPYSMDYLLWLMSGLNLSKLKNGADAKYSANIDITKKETAENEKK